YGTPQGASDPAASQGPYAAQVWNTSDGSPVAPPLVHDGIIIAAALSRDGLIAATYCNSSARLWRTDDGTTIATCGGLERTGQGAMPQIEFSADSALGAIGTADGAVRLYATSNGTLLDTIRHSQTITSIAFDPN